MSLLRAIAWTMTTAVLGASVAASAPSSARSRTAPPCIGANLIGNASFDTPSLGTRNFRIVPQAEVAPWRTTAADGNVELWRSGFNGANAVDGNQLAEIAANGPATLYQDVPTAPGSLISYVFSHRGRGGVDTMALQIGTPAGPPQVVRTDSAGPLAWTRVIGTYLVPAGQTSTRFGFAWVSGSTNNPANGNLLDSVFVSPSRCTLSLTAAVVPPQDPGRFDLHVGDDVVAAAVGDHGTSGERPMPLSAVRIAETAAPGTDLADYASALRCVDADNPTETLLEAAATEATLTFDRPRRAACTAFNVRRPALFVQKSLAPADDPGRFDLYIDRTRVAAGVGDGALAGPITTSSTVTVSERPAPGTSSADYESSIQCRDHAGTGALVAAAATTEVRVAVPDGAVVGCSVLNLRTAPTGGAGGVVPEPAIAPRLAAPTAPPADPDDLDLKLTARAITPRIRAGSTGRIDLRVTNRGPLPATDVRVVPILRQGGRRISRFTITGAGAQCRAARGVGLCRLPRLAVGASVRVTLRVPTSADRHGAVRLRSFAVAAQRDRAIGDNSDTATVQVIAPARRCAVTGAVRSQIALC